MIDPSRKLETDRLNPAATAEIDRILTGFFRAEQPDPWPAFKTPPPNDGRCSQPTNSPRRTIFRFLGKLAPAAAIAAFVLAYHAFQSQFPDPKSSPTLQIDANRPIGLNLKPRSDGVLSTGGKEIKDHKSKDLSIGK